MLALKDVDVLGLFVTPAVPCALAAFVLCALLRRLFDRIHLDRYVWNRPFCDLCVLVCIADLLVLSLRFGSPR